jgi:hypothetical protein
MASVSVEIGAVENYCNQAKTFRCPIHSRGTRGVSPLVIELKRTHNAPDTATPASNEMRITNFMM